AGRGHDPPDGVDRGLAPQGVHLRAGYLVAGVVARADERTGLDVPEAEVEGLCLHVRELVRVVVAHERQVPSARPQVLAHGEDVAVDLAERDERRGQLGPRLAEPDHERALRVYRVPDLGGVGLGLSEDAEAAIPAGPLADGLLEPLDRLG